LFYTVIEQRLREKIEKLRTIEGTIRKKLIVITTSQFKNLRRRLIVSH
jgi:hypothetical protein